jgi:hypothetical protein
MYCYCGDIAQRVPYTATITDLLCFPIWILIIPDHPLEPSSGSQQRRLEAKQEETWCEMFLNLAYKYLFSYCMDLQHAKKKILHGTDSFTSHPKEVVLRIFVAIKN